jgi:hypothetical protein
MFVVEMPDRVCRGDRVRDDSANGGVMTVEYRPTEKAIRQPELGRARLIAVRTIDVTETGVVEKNAVRKSISVYGGINNAVFSVIFHDVCKNEERCIWIGTVDDRIPCVVVKRQITAIESCAAAQTINANAAR